MCHVRKGCRCDVDVLVGHGHHPDVLLLRGLPSQGELRCCPHVGGLRCLSASVGVDLRVQHEHVEVLVRSEDVVQPSEPNVVRPPITTDKPLRDSGQHVTIFVDGLQERVLVLVGRKEGDQPVDEPHGLISVILLFEPLLQHGPHGGVPHRLVVKGLLHQLHHPFPPLVPCCHDPKPELRVVFEEGVGPRRTLPLLVHGVRVSWVRPTPDTRAPRCVRDHQPLPEELCQELHIRCLTAPLARPGELHEGLPELAPLDTEAVHHLTVVRQVDGVLEVVHLCGKLGVDVLHSQRIVRAVHHTHLTPRAVQGGDLNAVPQAVELRPLRLPGDVVRVGGFLCLLIGHHEGTDHRVRAQEGAVVALCALVRLPRGDLGRHPTLFKARSPGGDDSARGEVGDWDAVTVHSEHWPHHLLVELALRRSLRRCAGLADPLQVAPLGVYRDLLQSLGGCGHCVDTAVTFIWTTFSPLDPYVLRMASLRRSRASSKGSTPESLKKAVCITMLMRPFSPTCPAIFEASTMYIFAFFRARVRFKWSGSSFSISSRGTWVFSTKTPSSLRQSTMGYLWMYVGLWHPT
eukprot:Sspe_Gene.3873::Locus_1292_Transcript_2_5_Confidence_0.333_Length_5747::g.3873::m.3873